MRAEVLGDRGHLGRPPNVAQCQRISAHPAFAHNRSRLSLRRAGAAVPLLSGNLAGRNRQRGGREDGGEGKKLAKDGKHRDHLTIRLGAERFESSLGSPLTLTGVGYHNVTRAFARFEWVSVTRKL